MKKPKLNTQMLKKVLKHVKAEPKRFDMGDFIHRSDTAPCGTQACLAGWAVLLKEGNTAAVREKWNKKVEKDMMSDIIQKKAEKALGLTPEEGCGLFLTYTDQVGKTAVKTAEKKINLLLEDRDAFEEKYYRKYLHG